MRGAGALCFGVFGVVVVAGLGVSAEGEPEVRCPVCVDCGPIESELESVRKAHSELNQDKMRIEGELTAAREAAQTNERNAKEAEAKLVATANQLRTDKEHLVSERNQLVAARDQLASEKDQLASAKEQTEHALKEAEAAKANCGVFEAQLDEYAEARKKSAEENEELRRTVAQLQADKKNLGDQAEVLKVERLVVVENERKTHMEESQNLRKQLAEQREAAKAASAEKEQKILKLESNIEKLDTKYTELYNQKKHFDYIFSVPQFNALCSRMYTFSRSFILFSLQRQKELINVYTSPAVKDAVVENWEKVIKFANEQQKKVTDLYQSQMKPHVSQLTKTAQVHYRRHLQPIVSQQSAAAAIQLKAAQRIAKTRASEAIVSANRYVDHYFVNPLVQAFPETEPLIPDGIFDRICLVIFVLLLETIALRNLRRAVRVLKCVTKYSLGLLFCWPCRRSRSKTSSSRKGGKGDAEKQRNKKSFKPAAAAPNAPTTQQAAASGASKKGK